MNEQKSTLPLLRNVEWRTLKIEKEKNKSTTNIYTNNNIIELSEPIYSGVKLVREKIGVPLKSISQKSKPTREIRLETLIRKLRKQAK